MDTALWIVQVLLALAFGLSGFAKIAMPRESLSTRMKWVNSFPPSIVKLIGLLEVLAAIGLILPPVTHILPWLTPLAAVGLVLTMIGAAITHIRIGEGNRIGVNVVLLLLALFVAYGRFFVVPLA